MDEPRHGNPAPWQQQPPSQQPPPYGQPQQWAPAPAPKRPSRAVVPLRYGVAVVVGIIIGASFDGGDDPAPTGVADSASLAGPAAADPATEEPDVAVDEEADAVEPDPAADTEPDTTLAQEQALQSAQSYLSMSGFSRAGLIQQLTSKAGEGFKKADAVYAVNHLGANWNAEAVESAKSYLSMGGFSRSSLIEQLSSKAGEGYTLQQAKYAVKKVGL